eukprot:g23106.t1
MEFRDCSTVIRRSVDSFGPSITRGKNKKLTSRGQRGGVHAMQWLALFAMLLPQPGLGKKGPDIPTYPPTPSPLPEHYAAVTTCFNAPRKEVANCWKQENGKRCECYCGSMRDPLPIPDLTDCKYCSKDACKKLWGNDCANYYMSQCVQQYDFCNEVPVYRINECVLETYTVPDKGVYSLAFTIECDVKSKKKEDYVVKLGASCAAGQQDSLAVVTGGPTDCHWTQLLLDGKNKFGKTVLNMTLQARCAYECRGGPIKCLPWILMAEVAGGLLAAALIFGTWRCMGQRRPSLVPRLRASGNYTALQSEGVNPNDPIPVSTQTTQTTQTADSACPALDYKHTKEEPLLPNVSE